MEWSLKNYKIVGQNQIKHFCKPDECEVMKATDDMDYFVVKFSEEAKAVKFTSWLWENKVMFGSWKSSSGRLIFRIKVLGMTHVIKRIWNEYFGEKEEKKDDSTRN